MLKFVPRVFWGGFFAALLAAGLSSVPGSAAPPQRVVSTNLCTDQLVLELLPRSRIAAVSSLAANPAFSAAAEKAQGIPVVATSAEAVIRHRPDLVVAGRLHERWTAALLARYGISVHFVASPDTLAETETTIRDLAARLEVSEAGEAMIAQLKADFSAARAENAVPRRALILRPNGHTSGSQSLYGALMAAAGLYNLADELGVVRGGLVPLEAVLAARPDMLIVDDPSTVATSRAQALTLHPALLALPATRRQVPMAAWICAGPRLPKSAHALAAP